MLSFQKNVLLVKFFRMLWNTTANYYRYSVLLKYCTNSLLHGRSCIYMHKYINVISRCTLSLSSNLALSLTEELHYEALCHATGTYARWRSIYSSHTPSHVSDLQRVDLRNRERRGLKMWSKCRDLHVQVIQNYTRLFRMLTKLWMHLTHDY